MALRRCAVLLVLVASLIGGAIAHADSWPSIVVPGKRGVPVIINGRDATGAMVIGDWGLYRPGHVVPTVVPLRRWRPAPRVRRLHSRTRKYSRTRKRRAIVRHQTLHYFPGGAIKPPEPRRKSDAADDEPPQPAESYSREWTTTPMKAPVDIGPPTIIEIDAGTRQRRPRPGRTNDSHPTEPNK